MSVRRVQIGCDFVYDSQVEIPAVFQVTPLGVDGVVIKDEQWTFSPEQDTREYRDI